MADAPTYADAWRIADQILPGTVARCERFPTGLRNWVYDIELADGTAWVLRLSQPDNRHELAAGMRWTRRLCDAGVPVAPILEADLEADQPYLLLERLAGTDLGNTWHELGDVELQGIATTVSEWQFLAEQHLTETPSGFGFALDYDDAPFATWAELLAAQIDRSERWIRAAGVVDPAIVDEVQDRLHEATWELRDIEPTPFLHDATTKNVIVHNRVVTGLVDVDHMAFGDPLYIAALTRMSLLSAGRSTQYSDNLATRIRPDYNADHYRLYTLVHCLGFLGELGQAFNKPQPAAPDPAHHRLLESTMASLLAE